MSIHVVDKFGKSFGTADRITKHTTIKYGEPLPSNPGKEVDRMAKEKMRALNVTYSQALQMVLADPANAQLKQDYAHQGRR
jgi:hypothetical protein